MSDPISFAGLSQASLRNAPSVKKDELPYSPHGTPFVDGGLTAAVKAYTLVSDKLRRQACKRLPDELPATYSPKPVLVPEIAPVSTSAPTSAPGPATLCSTHSCVSPQVPFVPDALLSHVTVSPISGPRGVLRHPSALGGPTSHLHLCPADDSPRIPFVEPRLAGMRCFLSRQNLNALRCSLGASPAVMRRWYERGQVDAETLLSHELEEWWLTTPGEVP